ncbi:MAG: hypothetical protein ABIR68_01025 [Ilumatobacteraceae bacterium]
MIVVVASSASGEPALTLEQPDDCGAFHLEARGIDAGGVATALAKAGAGTINGDDAFIAPAVVERLAAGHVGADWAERFAGMLAYAETKGWRDADGAVQAHIEWT